MGRKRMNRNKAKGNLGSRVEVVSGRTLVPTILNSSAALPIAPVANFPRLAAIADLFQFYRFTHIRAYCMPAEVQMGLAYAPGAAFDTPPTSLSGILELPIAVAHGAFKTTDTVLTVSRKELVGDSQLKWYKTVAGTPAAQFEIQGNLYWVSGAGGTAPNFVVEWTCELQSWNLAAQSPMKLPGKTFESNPTTDLALGLCDRDRYDKSSSESSRSDSVVIGGVLYKRSAA